MSRPRPALRIAILIAAVACLGLAMCARSRPQQPTPPTTQQAPNAAPTEPAPGEGKDAGGTELEEGTMGKGKKNVDRFPATKAPGRLY